MTSPMDTDSSSATVDVKGETPMDEPNGLAHTSNTSQPPEYADRTKKELDVKGTPSHWSNEERAFVLDTLKTNESDPNGSAQTSNRQQPPLEVPGKKDDWADEERTTISHILQQRCPACFGALALGKPFDKYVFTLWYESQTDLNG